jgi:hypothetical protein
LTLFLFQPGSISPLQPTLRRNILISLSILLKCREKGGNAGDGSCFTISRRVVGRGNPSKRWTRRKECKKIWWELVCHLSDKMLERRAMSFKRPRD